MYKVRGEIVVGTSERCHRWRDGPVRVRPAGTGIPSPRHGGTESRKDSLLESIDHFGAFLDRNFVALHSGLVEAEVDGPTGLLDPPDYGLGSLEADQAISGGRVRLLLDLDETNLTLKLRRPLVCGDETEVGVFNEFPGVT